MSFRWTVSGPTPPDGERAARPEVVLDLLQGAAASLWDAHGVEQQADDTHHGEAQVGHVEAVRVHQVGEAVCEHEGRQPADGDTKTGRHAPGNQRQHL